jgi:hypothetical protein
LGEKLGMALANAPKKGGEQSNAGQQQGQTVPQATVVNPIHTNSQQSGHGCPGTNQTQLDCNALTAIATVRQADAAEYFNSVVWVEIGIGALTALFAYFAAHWAKRAAEAGRKSYEAFVAAEDAYLSVEFPNGIVVESIENGVRSNTYHLTFVIANLGRSTARIHGCSCGDDQHIPIQQNLKTDESLEKGWRLQLDRFEPFDLHVSYDTPIRERVELIVTGTPTRHLHGKAQLSAYVTGRRFGTPARKRKGGRLPWRRRLQRLRWRGNK